MPPTEARQIGIMRPRQSLSCVVCRRRKVRCGREQPACSNCVRIHEACEYENDPPNCASRQAKRVSMRDTSGSEAAPSPLATEEHLSSWAAQQRHLPPPNQTFNIDTVIEADESSRHRAASHYSVSASSPVDRRHGSSINSSNRPTSQTPTDITNPFFPPTRPLDLSLLSSKSPPFWNASSPEDHGHPLQLATPSLTTSTTEDSEFFTPQKRRRTAERVSYANGQDVALEDPTHGHQRTRASADFALDFGEDSPRRVGYLSIQKGGRIRHVGNAFWGLIKGHESLCDTFLGEKYDIPDSVPLPYIDSSGLAGLLTTLPKKVVCDALLQSFSISIHPIHPLIHLPTFQIDYNNFWQWCRNSDISQPDNKLLGDPTFLCLLFSILYCSAMVSPLEMWMADSLQDLDQDITVEQLRTTYLTSLTMCQHLQHPTFSTLVSSLLAHSCSKPDAAHFGDFSTILRIAQNMGLHRDGSSFGLDAITSELRRRVWWHVVWIDVQASILHGSQICCGSNEAQNEVRMVSEIRDENLSIMTNTLASRGLPLSPSVTSIAMLLAIGRFETALFKQFLVNSLDNARDLGQAQFDKIVSAAKSMQTKLDRLIVRIPTQGISETGFIPSRLANASPLTYKWLYSDCAGQATIWNSWAKNMLTLLKTEVAILVQKSFLGRADSKSKQQQKMWNSVVQLCITYLRKFIQLVRIPAFAPYSWFCINSQIPLQPVFLILAYLQDNKNCANGNLGRHFVDEVIDVFSSPDDRPFHHREDRHDPAKPSALSSDKETPLLWKMLAELRSQIDHSSREEPTHVKPVAPTRCQLVPPAIALRTMSLSTNEKSTSSPTIPAASRSEVARPAANVATSPPIDPAVADGHSHSGGGDSEGDNPLDTFEYEEWCASLTQDPNAFFLGDQDAAESVHDAPSSNVEYGAAPARFGEMLDDVGN